MEVDIDADALDENSDFDLESILMTIECYQPTILEPWELVYLEGGVGFSFST